MFYIDKYTSFLLGLKVREVQAEDLQEDLKAFSSAKADLDEVFSKSPNFSNPRSIQLYFYFVYFFVENVKLQRKLKQKFKITMEKISNQLKNNKPIALAHLYDQKTVLLKVEGSSQGQGRILEAN